MRQRNRLALGALAAAIVAIAVGASVYAMRPSDEQPVLRTGERGTPQADAREQATPGGVPSLSSACLAGAPDCDDTVAQPDAELTCEQAGACADATPPNCPPDAVCGAASSACAEGATCSRPARTGECAQPQGDAMASCATPSCGIGGGPAENIRCFPPAPCGPAPEPGSGESRADGATPTPCAPPSLPPDCTISSDGAIACPDDPPHGDPGPGGSEPGSPGVAPPPVVVTAVAQ